MQLNARQRHRRTGLIAVGILVCLAALVGCGSRLSQQQLLSDARGGLTTTSSLGDTTTGSGTGTTTGTTNPGSTGTTTGPSGTGSGTSGTSGLGTSTGTSTTGDSGTGSSTAGSTSTGKSTSTGNSSTKSSGKKSSTTSNTQAGRGSTCASTGGSPIVIGSVSELSGPAGASEAQGVTALKVWANMINAAGGICGRQIQVIAEDSQGDPNTANSEIEDLIQNRHVVAFVDEEIGLVGVEVAPTFEKSGVPVFGGECASVVWNETVGMFPQCASVSAEAYGDLYAAKHYGTGNKLGLFTCIETSLCPAFRKAAEHFAPKIGIDLVYNQTVSLTQVDFTQQCIGARKAGATMVTVVADSASLGRFGVDCARQNYDPLYAQGSATVSGTTNTEPGLSKVIVGIPTFPFAGVHGNPAINQFTAAMAKYDPGDPVGPAASFGWAGAKLFQTVAQIAAAKGAITPASLMAAAYTLRHNTLGGLTAPLTYIKGKPAPDFKCTFMISGKGGHWTAPIGLHQICAP